MRRYRGLFRPLGAFTRAQFSADYTISMFGFNLRQGQWEMSDRQDGIFSRSDFHWDRKRGAYICPNGKLLKTSGTVHDGRTLLYRASKRDCDVCPIRAKCCTTADARKIPRDIHEDARDIARRKMKTKAWPSRETNGSVLKCASRT